MKKINLVFLVLIIIVVGYLGYFGYNTVVKSRPDIKISAVEAGSGWDINMEVENFIVGKQDGHVHLYINDNLVSLVFDKVHHIDPLPRGEHNIRAVLFTPLHKEIKVLGEAVADSVVLVSEVDGVMPPALKMDMVMNMDMGGMGVGYGKEEKTDEEVFVYDPKSEVYTNNKWNPRDIMVVVEKSAGGLAFVDGSKNETIARINGLGKQPHTMVFSADAKYGYLISRDGWLSKIDLNKIEVAASIKVGESSRGTAMTDSGKYIAVGNYDPNTLVILDAKTLEIVKEIPLTDTRVKDGTPSRAGALLEFGEMIAVALKDINSVWIIDTSKKGIPVTNYFWDVGDEGGVMHDGYATPDGRHLVFSIEQSNVVWILDALKMEEVGEIKTGVKPHTGPGATWKNLTFIPAIEEGKTTVIDTDTWKLVEYIETGYPSQFPRSYTRDDRYPYVWLDTWEINKSDELYIIDARDLSIVKTIVPIEGSMVIHPEFTYDGKYVYVSMMQKDMVYIYDANTFEFVTKLDITNPTGIFNVGLRTSEAGL
jgi:DNA-binding beta-propeller fold protein YncE